MRAGEEFAIWKVEGQGETLEEFDHEAVALVLERFDLAGMLVPEGWETVAVLGGQQRARHAPEPHGHLVVLAAVLEATHVPDGVGGNGVLGLERFGQREEGLGQAEHFVNVARRDGVVLKQEEAPFATGLCDLVGDAMLRGR